MSLEGTSNFKESTDTYTDNQFIEVICCWLLYIKVRNKNRVTKIKKVGAGCNVKSMTINHNFDT